MKPPNYNNMTMDELIEYTGQWLGADFERALRESVDSYVDNAVAEAEAGFDL